MGFISLFLGIIGIFIPLLPTTPFLLLTAFCFAKSSKRFHNMITNNKLLFSYIDDYQNGKGIKRKVKISAIIFLWASMFFSVLLYKNLDTLQISVLFIIGVSVTIHILLIKKKNFPKKDF